MSGTFEPRDRVDTDGEPLRKARRDSQDRTGLREGWGKPRNPLRTRTTPLYRTPMGSSKETLVSVSTGGFDTKAYRRLTDSMESISNEIRSIASKKRLTEEDDARLASLEAEFTELQAQEKDLQRDALARRISPVSGQPLQAVSGHTPKSLDDDPFAEPDSAQIGRRKFDNPWSITQDRHALRSAPAGEWRARALDAIEKAHGSNDEAREAMTDVLESFDNKNADLSRMALFTSHPDYLRWFGEMLQSGGQNPLLTAEEQQAARRVRDEARAMSLTDTSGGFLIPFQLDPAVINTSDGSMNPVRAVARRVVATGDTWNGVSAGATEWSWDAEAEQVSDDASTFAQPSITIHGARGFIPISYEALQDEANVTDEIRRLLAFGRSTLEETAFITGTGTGEPFGIVTALNGAAPPVVAATTNDAFAKEDIYKLSEALPGRYRRSARSAWFANIAIWNDVDLFETSNGAKLFEGVVPGQRPGTLLGSPTYEAEAMDGAIATGNDYVLVYGDFDSYVIADRFSSVELIPHLFGANQRPTGQRGIFGFFRMGADSVNDSAFKLLRV